MKSIIPSKDELIRHLRIHLAEWDCLSSVSLGDRIRLGTLTPQKLREENEKMIVVSDEANKLRTILNGLYPEWEKE